MSTAVPQTLPADPDTEQRGDTETRDEHDLPWDVIVWNDPVTLMSYVVYVLRKIFGYDEQEATRLMLLVHHEGKAVVASEPRAEAETAVAKLHAHGLQATLARS